MKYTLIILLAVIASCNNQPEPVSQPEKTAAAVQEPPKESNDLRAAIVQRVNVEYYPKYIFTVQTEIWIGEEKHNRERMQVAYLKTAEATPENLDVVKAQELVKAEIAKVDIDKTVIKLNLQQ